MYSGDRGDGYGPKQLQWQNMMMYKAKRGHRAKGPNNDKNQESFREEEAFELKCKLDGRRGK